MASISNRMPAVTISYNCRNKIKTKTFSDVYAARRFYIQKMKSGNYPRIHKAEE